MTTTFWDWKLKIWQILVIILIAVIIYFAACNGSGNVERDAQVQNVPEQKATIIKDSTESKRILDSMNRIFRSIGTTVSELTKERNTLTADMKMQSDIIYDLLNKPNKDSDYNKLLQERVNDLMITSVNKDSNCIDIISLKDKQIALRDQQLSQKDTAYKKLRMSEDTCLKNQTALEADRKRLQPHNKIAIGPVGNFYPDPGIGGGITFIGKRGLVIEGNVLKMNKNWYYQAGVKFVISLRKK